MRWENVLIEAVVALEGDPNVVSQELPLWKPRRITAQEYVSTMAPRRPELVEGLYELGTLQAIVAKPKVAKTLLTLGLAVAVAKGGGEWLGRRVEGGRAAVFQLEDSHRTVGARLLAITSKKLPDDLLLHMADIPFRMSEDSYPQVADACRGFSLVIVDPIIQVARVGDWNAQQDVRNAYDLWRRLARELDVTVVVVAHHRKAVGDFGEQIAGSIQGLATPDGIVEVRRDGSLSKAQRRVSYVGRDWADLEDEVIELNPSTLTYDRVSTASDLVEERRQ